ncbi:MAG: GNAT family N-acetyltransferase [Actinomycetota bacterium]
MLVRRERPDDAAGIRRIHTLAFAPGGRPAASTAEAALLDALRASDAWIPQLSLVAVGQAGVTGHVLCTRAVLGEGRHPVLGLGPLAVLPALQGRGIGQALVHAVLGAADALGEALVGVLGDPGYYGRFGFVPSDRFGIHPQDPAWAAHFQVRPLTAYHAGLRGTFRYAAAFERL